MEKKERKKITLEKREKLTLNSYINDIYIYIYNET